MALPIVGLLAGIGGGIGYIAKSAVGWLAKKVEALPFFLIVLSINSIVIGLFVAYVTSVIKVLLFVYNQLDFLINYISSISIGSEIGALINDILGSMRFFEALHDVLTVYSPIITFGFTSLALKFGIKGLMFFRNSVLSLVVSKLT